MAGSAAWTDRFRRFSLSELFCLCRTVSADQPDDLVDLELITKDDLYPIPEFDAAKVDYGAVLNYKNALFKKAFQTFHHTPNKFLLEEFDDFCLENKKWLSDYAVFMACKDAHEGRSWQEWDDEMTTPTAKVRLAFETEYKEQIKYYKSSSSCSSVNG